LISNGMYRYSKNQTLKVTVDAQKTLGGKLLSAYLR